MSGPPTPRAAQLKAPGRAGVGIAVDQNGAGDGVASVGDNGMSDALVQADVVQALDAEMRREPAACAVRGRRLNGRGGDKMVEHDDDLGRIVHMQHLAPAFGQEGHVHQDRGFDIDDGEIARFHLEPGHWRGRGFSR